MLIFVSSALVLGVEKDKIEKKAPKDDLYTQVELFADTIGMIKSDYVDEVEPKKLIYGAMKGMLSSLDDFSQFMEPDEYKELKAEAKGEFGGIGVEISLKERILTVVTPMVGSPAETAGVKPGDKIIRIDGKITKDMSLSDAVKAMRGDPGTTVALTLWREKQEKGLDVQIKRAIIRIESIKNVRVLEDKVGYIKLVEFQEKTPRDLEEALKKLESEDIDSLVLDLRNNPGGLLDVSVDVAEKFLPKDTVIVSIKSRTPEQNIVFKSRGRFTHPDYPLVILVNEGSASASEIVAGAVQDNKRGLILGEKTFGKASVQTVMPLKDGSALRLTTATYLTPSGKMIMHQGIMPDIVVKREDLEPGPEQTKKKDELFEQVFERKDKSKEREKQRDNQLERAIDVIKALKIYKARMNEN
ncbi:MAG: hypothetical protein A2987_06025 [Omnitrophica bacterium RIFCSPLOWO2_01_FULL_45_10]|nr:MAG: hypothetical protein A2987_06025 [Omnitrophica bacterium RIFCSPLOWO2_01_FULL_45_10]